jgi:hypothetical protein
MAAHRGPGDRLIVVDQADAEIRAGRAQAGRAQVAGRGDRARQQHRDRLPEALARVALRPVAEQGRFRGFGQGGGLRLPGARLLRLRLLYLRLLYPRPPGLDVASLAAGNIGAGRAAPGNTAHRCHKALA